MSRVEFDEKNFTSIKQPMKKKHTLLVRLMMKLPFIKNVRQANIAMLAVAIVAFGVSFLVLTNTFGDDQYQIYYEDLTEGERESLPQEFLDDLPRRN